MPIHRGSRLDDLISRLPYVAAPIGTQQWYSVLPYQAALQSIGAGTPSAWSQMISAAQAPSTPFTVVPFVNGNYGNYVEIGIGASGSEVGVATSNCGGSGGGQYEPPQPFPIIPGGTRVAFRLYSGNGGTSTLSVGVLVCKLPSRLDVLNTLRWTRKMAAGYSGPPLLISTTLDTKNPQSAWTYTGTWSTIYPNNVESNSTLLTSLNFSGNYTSIAKFGWGSTPTVFGEFFADQANANNVYSCYLDLPIPLILPGSTAIQWDAQIATANGTLYYPRFGMYRLPQMGVW